MSAYANWSRNSCRAARRARSAGRVVDIFELAKSSSWTVLAKWGTHHTTSSCLTFAEWSSREGAL